MVMVHPPSPEERPLVEEVQRLFGVIWKRKWVVLLFIVASTVGSYLHTRKQPKIYRATATLVIDRSSPNVLAGIKEVVELGSSGFLGLRQYFKTQYRIITSEKLAKRVVSRLSLDRNYHFLGINPKSMTKEQIEKKIENADPARILQRKIEAEPLEESFIVYVHVRDTDPAFAANLATEVANTYRDENLAFRRKAINLAQDDLEKLGKHLQTEKETSARGLLEYERQNQVGTLSKRIKDTDIRRESMTGEITKHEVLLIELKARLSQKRRYERSTDPYAIADGEILDSALFQDLIAKAIEADSQHDETRYLDSHPRLKKMDNLKTKYEQRALRVARNKITAIRHLVTEQKQIIKSLRENLHDVRSEELELAAQELEYSWLKQRAVEAKGVYDQVSKRLLETRISKQVETNNVWVLDEAKPPSHPISPRMRLNLFMGLLFGLIGGIAIAFLFELADKSVKTDHDLELLAHAPVLGIVPMVLHSGPTDEDNDESDSEDDPALFVFHHPKSQAAEFCRSIRTNLMFMSPDAPLKSLLITSANAREGKTTVSASIAITMATSGSRVVLVDTDMRRPRLHNVFAIKERHGISTALINSNSIREYCYQTDIPNLDVIPCGPIPPNPAELLHTRRFQELLEELKGTYDYAIFDSPPVLPVTDSLVIGKHVDGVLMVVRAGVTSKRAVSQSKHSMDKIGVRLFGCVMNHVDAHQKNYRYYYHYYGGKYQASETTDESLV